MGPLLKGKGTLGSLTLKLQESKYGIKNANFQLNSRSRCVIAQKEPVPNETKEFLEINESEIEISLEEAVAKVIKALKN